MLLVLVFFVYVGGWNQVVVVASLVVSRAAKEGGGLREDLVGGGECVFVVRVGVVLAEVGLECWCISSRGDIWVVSSCWGVWGCSEERCCGCWVERVERVEVGCSAHVGYAEVGV